MKILVTGCAGFIGSHLSELLLRHGHDVVGIDNMNQYYDPEVKHQNLMSVEQRAESLKKEFVFYRGDIRQQDMVAQILRDHNIEAIIHLAAMAGVRPSTENPLLYVDVNETGTTTLLEESKNAGVKTFVFGSSSSVYGNNKEVPFSELHNVDKAVSPYAASKKSNEVMCHVYHKLYDMKIACLRFFTVYGPRQRPDLAINKFTKLILEGKKIPVYGDGTKSRDFTFVEDIIDGIYKSLLWAHQSQGAVYEIFNLGESETTDVNTLIKYLEEALDKKADIQYLPDVPGDVQTTFADISKAKKMLGYNPQTKIRDGLKKYVEWVLNK